MLWLQAYYLFSETFRLPRPILRGPCERSALQCPAAVHPRL